VRIQLKSLDEIHRMREAALVARSILDEVAAAVRPGVSTLELDRLAAKLIAKHRVESAFLGYQPPGCPPYPGVLCTAVNEVIVHGIPRKDEILAEGDIIGLDFGIFKHGFCADTARTVPVGTVDPERARLVEATHDALDRGIAQLQVGNRMGDVGSAIQKRAESEGFSVVRTFVGHGIGRRMHEDPAVPNFGDPGSGKRIKRGLVIAVEPMVNAGAPDVEVLDDEWTAVTKDRSLSAHFEHTIAILDDGPWVLTRPSSTRPGDLGTD
jgi:methionyl aminopeptidase